jgi:phosphoenolpyruvate-protein phosphotransferase (PTS system enzyme I)
MEPINGSTPKRRSQPEVTIPGRSVSRGIAIGRTVCLHGSSRQFYKTEIPAGRVPKELARFRAAKSRAAKQLERLISTSGAHASNAAPDIFAAHLVILDDPSLQKRVEELIESDRVNAEWAVKRVADEQIARFKSIPDEHLRERYIDLEDVAERILASFKGARSSIVDLGRESIVAAEELRPSTLVGLGGVHPKALITEHGGWTSHTFILARNAGIPAVTGLPNILRLLDTGDEVIVDGFSGLLIVNPRPETIEKYEAESTRRKVRSTAPSKNGRTSVVTLDGQTVTLRINADSPESVRRSRHLTSSGIGLYRTEYLFDRYNGFPTEKQQVEAYTAVAKAAGDTGVNIRTFDLSIGHVLKIGGIREKNPSLGLRGTRLALAYPESLRKQIRAILRSSFSYRIDLILPMISGVDEIIKIRAIIENEKTSLDQHKIPSGDPRIGAMIELPSAVINIEKIVKEVDFLCLGTNDLVQYILAVDRDNETIADWFRTLDPSVLKAIDLVVKAADIAGKQMLVCGEMAGSPFYTPILIGLGVRELSMNSGSIPRVRRVVEGLALEETQVLIERAKECRSSDEVESILRTAIHDKWPHLYPNDVFGIRET